MKVFGILRPVAACAALALSALLVGSAPAGAAGWGTITGQIVYGGGAVPPNPPAVVNKDVAHCTSKGPILKNELVVDKETKGIKWALVWLTGVDDMKSLKAIPTHPSLKAVKGSAVIDQPCCVFEPRVLGMREGQSLVIKNSSPVSHNSDLKGGPAGPDVNQLIPARGQFDAGKPKARAMPFMYTCSIHPWMKGYIGVFKHPYFVVTGPDGKFTLPKVPAGKYRLMAWHEQGWVLINPKNLKDRGKVIEIKDGGTTNVGKITFTPSKED
jgi:hypothetical protein